MAHPVGLAHPYLVAVHGAVHTVGRQEKIPPSILGDKEAEAPGVTLHPAIGEAGVLGKGQLALAGEHQPPSAEQPLQRGRTRIRLLQLFQQRFRGHGLALPPQNL